MKGFAMDATKKIAVVQGPGPAVQALFRTLAERWQGEARVVGAIAEDHGLPDRACTAGYLRSLADGARYPIFQDLGQGSQACHLAGGGAVEAAAAVRKDIQTGCDLVILSKFGKLEAGGGGLREAFAAAIEAGVPVLTSVGKSQAAAWESFAAPLFAPVDADAGDIRAWWEGVKKA
ncbi:MAG: DUF2478 domain-containing protein [Proteobacteria bacterium]|nr:DUF2478 domain-containing protein [Pseudomonadota bacterium]